MSTPLDRLRSAVIAGNLAITKRILLRYPDLWLNPDQTLGWCNLHHAAYHGNYLVCFHLVSFANRLAVVDLSAASIDLVAFDNTSILHAPLAQHHTQTLHYLLQEFPGRLWLDHKGPGGQTPLHYCAKFCFLAGLSLLLEKGADPAVQDENGDTPLHLCLQYGFDEGARVVLAAVVAGASPDTLPKDILASYEAITNARGLTPADCAASFTAARRYAGIRDLVAAVVPLAPDARAPDTTPGLSRAALASPIVLINTADRDPSTPVPKSPDTPVPAPAQTRTDTPALAPEKGRSHSQLLPSAAAPHLVSRRRANTAYSRPAIVKTPSLKLFTILPRANTGPAPGDVRVDVFLPTDSSPQSIQNSIATSISTSSVPLLDLAWADSPTDARLVSPKLRKSRSSLSTLSTDTSSSAAANTSSATASSAASGTSAASNSSAATIGQSASSISFNPVR